MVVMKAGGRAVAMRERACRAERAASAGGLRGRPMVTLQGNTTGKVLNEYLKKKTLNFVDIFIHICQELNILSTSNFFFFFFEG